MKKVLPYLIILVPISFLVGTILLALNGIKGWGWMLVGAIITSAIEIKTKK